MSSNKAPVPFVSVSLTRIMGCTQSRNKDAKQAQPAQVLAALASPAFGISIDITHTLVGAPQTPNRVQLSEPDESRGENIDMVTPQPAKCEYLFQVQKTICCHFIHNRCDCTYHSFKLLDEPAVTDVLETPAKKSLSRVVGNRSVMKTKLKRKLNLHKPPRLWTCPGHEDVRKRVWNRQHHILLSLNAKNPARPWARWAMEATEQMVHKHCPVDVD